MKRVAVLLVGLSVWSLCGCGALIGASIDAGFREALDDGRHPVYRQQSYGRHFVDALVDTSPRVDVDVTVRTRRRR